MVSYSGLRSYTQDFIIAPETKELIINTVQLRKTYAEMEEVIVSAQRPPIMIKKIPSNSMPAHLKPPSMV
ncbi:hypothetical protein [Paraflavitalea speifideaquila]|uniref:hypothetical protein n=1 Tax=Paraflavitalea speifideaquila TaxID=3076558 RepID=UPI0028EA3E21|nr:hypothetical protein [Paraflavitalea speifideiaquila]